MNNFNTVEEALEEFKKGNFVIAVDDENRENEGDLMVPAEKITAEKINFMTKYARGLICLPIIASRLKELNIKQMVDENPYDEAAFTISVDYKETSTGISAKDRATTIKKILDPNVCSKDFRRPGHIFPLKGKEGGVLKRAGHTEAAIDLARLAGLYPAGVICEIMNDDGSMARTPQLIEYAKKFGFKIITIESLIDYRIKNNV